MNAMWLDTDLKRGAMYHFKEHQKLILEAGQMLATALNWYNIDDVSWYKSTHINHPMNIWTRTSRQNWHMMYDYASALHESFYGIDFTTMRSIADRWGDDTLWEMDSRGECHKTAVKIVVARAERLVDVVFPDIGVTARPKCFSDWSPDDKLLSVEEAYQLYYTEYKYPTGKFTWRTVPEWA